MNRPKVSVFIAISLDGYIAKADGSIDWLENFNKTVPKDEDCGYRDFIDTVDILVMGRKSFEKVCEFEPWPYGDLPVVVLSSQKNYKIPAHLTDKVMLSAEPPKVLGSTLFNKGFRYIYVDGGVTIQNFINEGLVDEMTITIIPILLGEGCSLFGALNKEIQLKQVDSIAYDFGCIQIKYKVTKNI